MIAEDPQENYQTGWIKIFRSVMKKGWFIKGDYFKLWCYMLMQATHKEREYMWNGELIILQPGQFITGRKKMALETGIHEASIERALTYFEKIEQQIEQQKSSTSRLISIVNWQSYQTSEQLFEQPLNNGRTTVEQPLNTKQEQNTLKNYNNVKKNSVIEIIFPFETENFKRIWEVWRQFRAEIRKPYKSNISEQAALKMLSKYDEATAIKMIEQSIANSWQGIFELKNNNNGNQFNNPRSAGIGEAIKAELHRRGISDHK